jgi:hypothetical protein
MASNMLCRAGYGIQPISSNLGALNFLTGRNASSTPSNGPQYAQVIPHIVLPWRSSGNGGPGGTFKNAKSPDNSSGSAGATSLYHSNSSRACSISQSMGPANT